MDMIEQVNTATLKQQLCHYLGLARQGKPTASPATLLEIGGFGFANDPLTDLLKERKAR